MVSRKAQTPFIRGSRSRILALFVATVAYMALEVSAYADGKSELFTELFRTFRESEVAREILNTPLMLDRGIVLANGAAETRQMSIAEYYLGRKLELDADATNLAHIFSSEGYQDGGRWLQSSLARIEKETRASGLGRRGRNARGSGLAELVARERIDAIPQLYTLEEAAFAPEVSKLLERGERVPETLLTVRERYTRYPTLGSTESARVPRNHSTQRVSIDIPSEARAESGAAAEGNSLASGLDAEAARIEAGEVANPRAYDREVAEFLANDTRPIPRTPYSTFPDEVVAALSRGLDAQMTPPEFRKLVEFMSKEFNAHPAEILRRLDLQRAVLPRLVAEVKALHTKEDVRAAIARVAEAIESENPGRLALAYGDRVIGNPALVYHVAAMMMAGLAVTAGTEIQSRGAGWWTEQRLLFTGNVIAFFICEFFLNTVPAPKFSQAFKSWIERNGVAGVQAKMAEMGGEAGLFKKFANKLLGPEGGLRRNMWSSAQTLGPVGLITGVMGQGLAESLDLWQHRDDPSAYHLEDRLARIAWSGFMIGTFMSVSSNFRYQLILRTANTRIEALARFTPALRPLTYAAVFGLGVGNDYFGHFHFLNWYNFPMTKRVTEWLAIHDHPVDLFDEVGKERRQREQTARLATEHKPIVIDGEPR